MSTECLLFVNENSPDYLFVVTLAHLKHAYRFFLHSLEINVFKERHYVVILHFIHTSGLHGAN